MNQALFQEILNENYMRRRLKNPSFSIRAYSQRLGISHSALSELMSGKRKIGPKLGTRIADSLMIESQLRDQLFSKEATSARQSRKAVTLQADQYRVIADWYHFAILSLAETSDFQNDPEWIAKRLGIKKSEVKSALLRMERLNLITWKNNRIVITGESLASPDGNVDLAVRKTHSQFLEMAEKSLETDPLEKRDFTAMTMAIDPAKLPEARKRIRQFRDELCQFLESGSKKEVYELCFQLFPLSKEV